MALHPCERSACHDDFATVASDIVNVWSILSRSCCLWYGMVFARATIQSTDVLTAGY